jgi:hypothetical protein
VARQRLSALRTSFEGGKRACSDGSGNDRSFRRSRHPIASAKPRRNRDLYLSACPRGASSNIEAFRRQPTASARPLVARPGSIESNARLPHLARRAPKAARKCSREYSLIRIAENIGDPRNWSVRFGEQISGNFETQVANQPLKSEAFGRKTARQRTAVKAKGRGRLVDIRPSADELGCE